MATTISRDILSDWSVLVVDDDPMSLQVAQMILTYYGAQVLMATNGKVGMLQAIALRPRFIISDLSMPIMDGWTMLQRLKEDTSTRDIPVIALTSHAMVGDRDRALAAGFHNYLTKPLSPKTFIHDLLRLLVDIPDIAVELEL